MEPGKNSRGEYAGRVPAATLLVPCLNEAGSIGPALRSVLDDFVRAEAEILVIDGGSTDGTRAEVEAMIRAGEPIRILDNPGRIQSRGLNLGIGEARGRSIVRLDAHGLYPPGYVKRCLALLEEHDAVCAGGVMWPRGETPVQKAVAAAMRHPLGVGDARYHLGGYSGEYEGVYLGAFRREIFDKVGLFDPAAVTNEDAELYARIRKSGGRIWLDGDLKVEYFPRRSLGALFGQYFRYGRGRFNTTKKHGRLSSWRQAVPPAHLVMLLVSGALAFLDPVFLLYPGIYLLVTLLAAIFGRFENGSLSLRLLVFLSFLIMHTAWAAGFYFALLRSFFKKSPVLVILALLSCSQSPAPVLFLSDIMIREVGSGSDWCHQAGIKQDLGAYQNGLSIVQITKTVGALGNPDFIGWVDERADAGGIVQNPTNNGLVVPNPGGNVSFDRGGYIWYTYGGRSQDLAFDLFRSTRPYDVGQFKLVLDDFVDRKDDGSTSIRVFTAQDKVMLQWRQFGSTVPVVRARHRRYDADDFSRFESQVDIGAGMPNLCIEQVWSRYDPRFDYLVSSFHFFQLSPFLMGSAPFLYSKDRGTSWRTPDGKIYSGLPLDYPTASSLRISPWDHIADQNTSSWIEFESGVSPRGIPWMICPTGPKMEGSFFLYDRGTPAWRNTLNIGPIKGRLAGFSGGATKSALVFAFTTDARPDELRAVVSRDDGVSWSAPFLLDKLGEGDRIVWISYCQPSTAYEDDAGRFFYAFNNRRWGDDSHNRIKFARFLVGRGRRNVKTEGLR